MTPRFDPRLRRALARVRSPRRDTPERAALGALFDAGHYRSAYPDVTAAGLDPLDHYLAHGWREGRAPNEWFREREYRAAYGDVPDGMSGLAHYALAGAAEGRDARPRSRPIRPSSTPARPGDDGPSSPAVPAARWRPRLAGAGGPVALAISHDEYRSVTGGVQNVIADEVAGLRDAGWTYAHLAPERSQPRLADATHPGRPVLTIDDDRVGPVDWADLLGAVAGCAPRLIVHHLLGWAPERVAELAKLCQGTPVLWLHDFFTLCPSSALLRDDWSFCGAPPVRSAACRRCCHGADRVDHLPRIAALFAAIRPIVLAPSVSALAFWQSRSALPVTAAAVAPPVTLTPVTLTPVAGIRAPEGRLRVGFLGAPMDHKGWPEFAGLVARHADDPRYAFFRFGVGRSGLAAPITDVPVRVTPGDRGAMVDAVAAAGLDVAVNWSRCHETFSFTAVEALAGGAYVVARRAAGNVWPAVHAAGPAHGLGLGSTAELEALFVAGCTPPPRGRFTLRPGRGAADWVLG